MPRGNRAWGYKVTLCTKCDHPGGMHRGWLPVVNGVVPYCELCDCDGWDETQTAEGRWSDEMTDEARRIRAQGRA